VYQRRRECSDLCAKKEEDRAVRCPTTLCGFVAVIDPPGGKSYERVSFFVEIFLIIGGRFYTVSEKRSGECRGE